MLDRVTDTLTEATTLRHLHAQTKEEARDIAHQELLALNGVAAELAPVFDTLGLIQPDDEWVPADTAGPDGRLKPTKAIDRGYLAFAVSPAIDTATTGDALHEAFALLLTRDGKLEVVSTLTTVEDPEAEDATQPGAWYGDELGEIPDAVLAPEADRRARGRHVMTELTVDLLVDGPGFSTAKVLEALEQAIQRGETSVRAEAASLVDRQSALEVPRVFASLGGSSAPLPLPSEPPATPKAPRR